MRHFDDLINVVAEVIRMAHGEATDRELAVLVLDEVRKHEDDETLGGRSGVRQQLADTISEAIDAWSGRTAADKESYGRVAANDILAEFHVSLRADDEHEREVSAESMAKSDRGIAAGGLWLLSDVIDADGY